MIVQSPYDIRLLKIVNLKDTIYNIDRYIVNDYVYIKEKEKLHLKPFENDTLKLVPVILYGLTVIEKDITPFPHPIINTNNNWIALDLREVVGLTPDKENFTIRNQAEYDLRIQRFILTGLWAIGQQSSIYSLQFPREVFSSWLSDNITRKFGLDITSNVRLKVLAYMYYSSLFVDEFTENEFTKVLIALTKNGLPEDIVKDVYAKIENLNSIDDFIKSTFTVTGNIRLKKLDYISLLSVLTNTWLGLNSKELIILSLEHPPTWVSLVYSSLITRSFSKSYIATLTERLNKRKKGEEFLKELLSITSSVKVE